MGRKKKRTVVGKSIADYYFHGKISEHINEMKVDKKRLDKALENPNIFEDVAEVYDRYKLRQYEDFDEFRDSFEDAGLNLKMSDIKKLWKQYEHRDDLIFSGQYEEYRLELVKNNYIQAAIKSNLPARVIRNLKNLPAEKWKDLVYFPSTEKETTYDFLLPRIGEFIYAVVGVEDYGLDDTRGELEERIKSAFEASGNKYIIDDVERGRKYLERRGIEMEEYDQIQAEESIRDEVEIIGYYIAQDLLDKGHSKEEYHTKGGHMYIPGIGSNKDGSKYKDLVDAIIDNM